MRFALGLRFAGTRLNVLSTPMKPCLILLFAAWAMIAEAAGADVPSADEESTLEQRYQALLETARSPDQDFFAAYDAARDAGLGDNRLVEARIVKALVAGDLRGLIGMTDKIEQYRNIFDIGFDPNGGKKYLFSSAEDVQGLIHALKAIRAYQNDDDAEFEQHAKEAFWLWPRWAETLQLGRLIAERRFKKIAADYVAGVTLPLDTPLRDLDDKPTSLGDLLKGRKAVLLDFWASWCGPCLRSMPELQKRATNLPPQDVAVVAVNTDEEAPLEKARKIKTEKSMDMPWLVETKEHPLAKALLVDSIPRAVLVGPTGRVLFSGHPADERLSTILKELGVDENRAPPPRVDLSGFISPPEIAPLEKTAP